MSSTVKWDDCVNAEQAITLLSDLLRLEYKKPEGPFLDSAEIAMQEEISRILIAHDIHHEREYPLYGNRGKVDLFVTRHKIAIELKARGAGTEAVSNQILKYIRSERCDGLLLVTVSERHERSVLWVRLAQVKPVGYCFIAPHRWTAEELREPAEKKIAGLKERGVAETYVSFLEDKHALIQNGLSPKLSYSYDYDDPHLTVTAHCTLVEKLSGEPAGEGAGSASTTEKELTWGQGRRICPNCGFESVRPSQFPPRWDPEGEPGWFCDRGLVFDAIMESSRLDPSPGSAEAAIRIAIETDCRSQFAKDDTAITGQRGGRVPSGSVGDPHHRLEGLAGNRAVENALRLLNLRPATATHTTGSAANRRWPSDHPR